MDTSAGDGIMDGPVDPPRDGSDDGDSRTWSPADWPASYQRDWVAAASIFLIAVLWVSFRVGGPRTTQVFEDSVIALGSLGAALALTALAHTTTSATRRAWWLLALGVWFETLGELSWAAYSVFVGDIPYPGPPDVFYLAGYPFLALGFILLATDPRDSRPRLRLTLDGLVIGTALLTLSWHFALNPLLATSSLDRVGTWVSIAYPVLDILVGSIGFVVAVHTRGPRRIPLLLIALGIFAWAFGDSAFAYLEFSGGYTISGLGLLWLAGDLTIALGARHPAVSIPGPAQTRRHYEFSELVSPYVPFLLTIAVLAYLGFTETLDQGDVVLGTLVIIFLVVRQLYVFRDATRISRELEASEDMLAQRNQELLLINRIVRHDIRNDMAVAHGWAGELDDHVDEAGAEMVARIRTTTQHTIDLTQTLRDFVAALDSDSDIELEPTPLRATLEETLTSRRETYPHAEFTTDDVPDVAVLANPLLATVFRNILNNAVQHSDTPDPMVHVNTTTDGDTIQVRIADNGPGIPDDRKDTIFGRDERGLDSPGSGVGLYLVDTLVTTYGGDVWVEDNDPQGSVFVVELQVAPEPGFPA